VLDLSQEVSKFAEYNSKHYATGFESQLEWKE